MRFSFVIFLFCLTLQQCHSFSSHPRSVIVRTVDTKKVPHHLRDGALFSAQPRQRRRRNDFWSFDPSQVAPSLSWDEKRYLRIHQSVRKRRSVRRLVEISTILFGQIMRPLVCSLTRAGPQKDWEAFWSRRIRGKKSNAERVAEGFQQLGPTYVKLGQALATRPDILLKHPPFVPFVDALAKLQDDMRPFDNLTAKRIIRRDLLENVRKNNGSGSHQHQLSWNNEDTIMEFLDSLTDQPVAAASIAQVYKGNLPGYGDVAVKVQRPGIRKKVERDATLFHSLATWMECLKWPRGTPMDGQPLLGSMQVVKAVDEFTERVFEDMNFAREAANMQAFAKMYSHTSGTSRAVKVVVPELIPELCSSRVLVMEWIDGTKLTDICDSCEDKEVAVKENLALVDKAIECTLSQLLDTGLLHADPHTGNLLKVRTKDGKTELGYLDFGLVSSVPQTVRDGIVCAVVQVVFARNIEAVADLCADLELLPKEKLEDAAERKKLVDALKKTFDNVLIWPKDEKGLSTSVPRLRFEKLPESLATLVATFEFTIPPYTIANARALATLEGIGLELDPNFNILRVIYPYSIDQLMRNPSISKKVEETFMDLVRSPETRLFDPKRVMMLLNDWSLLTGYRKRKIFWDLSTSRGGRLVSRKIIGDWYHKHFRAHRRWKRKMPMSL